MAKRYLVTGGLGFLGAPLVRALVADGHTVRVLDNLSRGSTERLGDAASHVEVVNGDIRSAATVAAVVRGVQSVCHLAYINGTEFFYQRPAEVLEVGVKGMMNVIDGCLQAGVGELILASSSEVYQTPPSVPTDERVALSVPDPHNPRYSYGGGKIICELLALNYGREHFDRVIIFRPHNVFGPDMGGEHVIPQMVRRLVAARDATAGEVPFPIQGSGEQSRAFIYIDDFVEGLMAVIGRGEHSEIYNIGTTEEVKVGDLARRIARCLGMRIRVVAGPAAEGGVLRRCPDIAKLLRLGFEPRFTMDTALPPTVRWYEERTFGVADTERKA